MTDRQNLHGRRHYLLHCTVSSTTTNNWKAAHTSTKPNNHIQYDVYFSDIRQMPPSYSCYSAILSAINPETWNDSSHSSYTRCRVNRLGTFRTTLYTEKHPNKHPDRGNHITSLAEAEMAITTITVTEMEMTYSSTKEIRATATTSKSSKLNILRQNESLWSTRP